MTYSNEEMQNLANLVVQDIYDMLNSSDALDMMLDTDNELAYDEGMGRLYKDLIGRVVGKLKVIEEL